MIRRALTLTILLAAGALAAAYATGGFWSLAAAMMVLGGVWVAGERARWSWISTLMLGLFLAAAGVGAWLRLLPALVLLGWVAALSAWDAAGFVAELRDVATVDDEGRLGRRYLQRLLVVDALGLLVAILALTVRIRLGFGVALVVALIALAGLSRAVGLLGRSRG